MLKQKIACVAVDFKARNISRDRKGHSRWEKGQQGRIKIQNEFAADYIATKYIIKN